MTPARRSRSGPTPAGGGTVTAREDLLVGLCADLVAAPSVNPPGDTRAVAAVVAGFLGAHGLAPQVVAARPDTPNLVAVCDSGRPGPHLVLNVHMDTMEPGDEAAWTVPPFRLTERQGRLYGLGMGNMKGAVAAMALAFAELAEHRDRWTGQVTFTAVSDEVVFGPSGAAHLLAARPELVGDGLLCGEGPGWMNLAVAEKGVLWLALSAEGPGGHASNAQRSATATTRLARLLVEVDALNDVVVALPEELAGADDDQRTRALTANVGTITGGTFVGQMARTARAEVDLRVPPGLSLDDVEGRVRDAAAGIPGTRVERLKGWEPNWVALDAPLTRAVADAATRVRGRAPTPVVRLPASDASRWRALGVPAVCYGPQPTYSAGVDDYAERRDVSDCAKIYALAAETFLAAGP